MADLKIVISALNKASGDLNKVKQDITGVKDAGEKGGTAVQGFGDSLGGMMSKAALVAGAVAGVGLAMKEVYETAKEGAELEYARTRFDNLAASIGTVSDALLSDLKDATSGMMSDAELVAGAADFMALGLAKSHDEVVRLTTVAGALGMNMNQLVLTLTNQTTMRFDALGVSVDGFDAKVKALEASGLSANEAFTEAFLQQAEAQIGLVGNKAETSAGQIQIMESAFKNLGDAIKLTMADAMDGLAPALTTLADHMTENVQVGQQWKSVIDQLKEAKDKDLISGREYNAMLRDIGVHSGMGAITAEQLAIAQAKVNQIYGDAYERTTNYTYAIVEGRAQMVFLTDESEDAAAATETVADATNNADMAMRAYSESIQSELAGVTSLTKNFSGMISFAKSYDQALEDIVEQETIMANNPIGSEKYDEAKAKVDALKQSMADMANQVVLDMFMATIAVGGVTEAEANAYFNMAADMGLISRDAADAAIEAYGDAIAYINSLEIDPKTGNIIFEVDSSEADNYQPTPKRMLVKAALDAGEVLNWNPPTKTGVVNYQIGYMPVTPNTRAVGGPVTAGQQYNWQEYGYRGEVFVPSADGFVLSRADAERALARALYSGESAIDPERIGKAVAKALSGITGNKQGGNVYNLTMPTSNNPADVRTAFELMEAWA